MIDQSTAHWTATSTRQVCAVPSSGAIRASRSFLNVMNAHAWLRQGARRVALAPGKSRSLLVVTLSWAVVAAAQIPAPASHAPEAGPGYQIVSAVVAGGGISRAQNSCFELSATVGQPAVGLSANSSVSLVAGFWGGAVHGDTLFRSSFEACQP